ncbi:MAG: serine hydrolase [Thermoanaerobaculia bacterium]
MKNRVVLTVAALFVAGLGVAQESASGTTNDLAAAPEVRDAVRLLNVWVEEQMSWQRIPGLALGVVHGDALVWARGYGVADLESGRPVTPQTLFRMGSVTKLFTATAVMQLRDAGKLRLDDPVGTHLSWFRLQSPFDGAPPITLRHLLTHTSGLPREAAFPYWTTHEFPTLEELKAALPEQTAVFPPGEEYKYSNLGLAMLGAVVAEVAGEPYEEYVRKHILEPLGMESTTLAPSPEDLRRLAAAYMRRTPDGARRQHTYYPTRSVAPAANLISNVEDMARFAALHLREGSPEGRPVLDRYTLAEMRRPQFVYDSWSGGRGLGFAVSHEDGTTFVAHGGWIGGHRTHLLLVPEAKIGVVAMTNAEDVGPAAFARRAFELVGKAIVEAAAEPLEERRADPAWERLVGTYSDPWGWEYRVLILDEQLVMYDSDYPPVDDPEGSLTPLEPVDGKPLTFRMSDGEHVVFELSEDGRVERMQRRYDYLYPVEAEE